MEFIIKLLLVFSPFCSWQLSGKENFNEHADSSWGEKAGLPKPIARLSTHNSRDFSVTLRCSAGLSSGLGSSLQEWLCFGHGYEQKILTP